MFLSVLVWWHFTCLCENISTVTTKKAFAWHYILFIWHNNYTIPHGCVRNTYMSSFWQAKETISKLAFGSLCWERSFVHSIGGLRAPRVSLKHPKRIAVMINVAMPCYAIVCDVMWFVFAISWWFSLFPQNIPQNLEPRSPQRALNRRKTIASAAPLDEQRIFPAFQKRMIFHESEASGLWWGGAPGTSVAFSRVNIESPWDRTLNTWGVSPIREKRCLLGAGSGPFWSAILLARLENFFVFGV